MPLMSLNPKNSPDQKWQHLTERNTITQLPPIFIFKNPKSTKTHQDIETTCVLKRKSNTTCAVKNGSATRSAILVSFPSPSSQTAFSVPNNIGRRRRDPQTDRSSKLSLQDYGH